MNKIFTLIFVMACTLQTLAQSSLSFIENQGQWSDSFIYKSNNGNADIYIETNGYTVRLGASSNVNVIDEAKHHGKTDGILKYHVYKMYWVGSSLQPEINGSKEEPYFMNFFLGNEPSSWRSNIKPVKVIDYTNIYSGINVHITSSDGNLKYDYIISPKADPGLLKLRYEGIDKIEIKKGALVLQTSVSEIVEETPYAFQYIQGNKKEVKCHYIIHKDGTIGFTFPNGYDNNYELTIDPTIVFSSLTGSTSDNWGFTATYDEDGNLYAGGIVDGSSYPTTTGAYSTTYAGGVGTSMPCDIAITKFNSDGTSLIYSTLIGGSGNDYPHSLVVDSDDNLYIAGKTSSTNYPTTSTAYNVASNGGYDIIVTKFNPTGTALIGSTYIGGSNDDGTNVDDAFSGSKTTLKYNYGDNSRSEILLDNSNNVFVASSSQSSNFPVTSTAVKSTISGSQDGVVFKLNTNLSGLIWSTYIGGSSADAAYCLAFNKAKTNLFVGGGTQSSDFMSGSMGGLYTSNQGGVADGYILKFQNSGSYSLTNGTFIGTNAYDQVYGIQTDYDNDVYAMGQTLGAFPVSSGVYSNADSRQFLIKLNNTLSTSIYSTVWGSGAATVPNITPVAFLVDTCEHVYISGWGGYITGSSISGMPTTSDALQPTTDGSDFYFIVFDKDATSLLYASYFGASTKPEHVDGGTSRFDPNGIVYQAICASCGPYSSAYPSTPGAWATTKGSSSTNCNLGALKIAFNLGSVQADAETLPSDKGCAPFTVNFNNLSKNAKDYDWDFGDGKTSTAEHPINTYTSPGTYTVRLIASNDKGCIKVDTFYITITVIDNDINPDFTYEVLDSCTNFSVQFTNTSTSYSPTPLTSAEYIWRFGDGSADFKGPTPPIHNYPGPGTYKVTLMMYDSNACTYPDSIQKDVIIQNSNVVAEFEPLDSCSENKTISFNNLSINGKTYSWNFGDGSGSTDASPTHTFPDYGTYDVWLTAANPNSCNGVDSFLQKVNVYPLPSADFFATPVMPEVNIPIKFNNTSVSGTSFHWDFGDGKFSSEFSPEHLYNKSGYYKVCLTVQNEHGCKDVVCKTIEAIIVPLIDLPTAFSPNGDGNNDVLFPRGFAVEEILFQVYNRWGELVFESKDLNKGWDGTYKGQPQPMETYAYYLKAVFFDGTSGEKQGNVTLIR